MSRLFKGQYSQFVNGPPPFIFEHCRLVWARIKDKSATNVSAREVGSRKKNNAGLRRQFQTIHTHFSFSLNECADKDFCLRIFAQPEQKIIETKKSGKITPIVLLSTAVFTCFNRPKNKKARHNNSLSKPAFSPKLDIKRFVFIVFFSFLFFELFFAVKQLAQSEIIFKTVKRCKIKTCLLADRKQFYFR